MMCSHVLVGLWKGLVHAVKHEKISLLFHYPEGHPLRQGLLKKIQATEKAAKGVELVLHGGTAEMAQQGFDEMIEALDAIIPKLTHQSDLQAIYEERAGLISIREKLKHLDELLALPDGDDEEVEQMMGLDEDEEKALRKHQLN